MRLSLKFIIPLLIALAAIAYGTSTPEVIVGIQAGWTGHGGLALLGSYSLFLAWAIARG